MNRVFKSGRVSYARLRVMRKFYNLSGEAEEIGINVETLY
jgi:hypothetical protein